MAYKTFPPHGPRAKRYAIHVPVYFRELGSRKWSEGTTDNISSTGVLFQSPSSVSLNTALELRLHIAVAGKSAAPAVIRSKGVVVRQEQRDITEAPVALAVAMRDCRIVRQPAFKESAKNSWPAHAPGGLTSAGSRMQHAEGLL